MKEEMGSDQWEMNFIRFLKVWLRKECGLKATLSIIRTHSLSMTAFEDYCTTNDISDCIPPGLVKKLEMMVDVTLPGALRRILSKKIDKVWSDLQTEERKQLTETVVWLLQN